MASPRIRWPRRGEVYLLNFGESRGHEMAHVHPCVVLQNDTGNQFGGTTIVAAITGNLRAAALPIGVRVKSDTAGLAAESVINCSHLYTIDKSRLGKRIGSFDSFVMTQIDRALTISIGLRFTP